MTACLPPPSTPSPRSRLVHILLVEDSPADIELTRQALAEARIANQVSVVNDGEVATRFLRREAPFHGAARPDLILLDLNLPKKDGRELLAEIKHDPELRSIPVVVLTTSASDEDIRFAYHEHVNSYIRKPVRLNDFINVIRVVDEYWLNVTTLPPAGGES